MASFTISGASPPFTSVSVKKTGDSVERFQSISGSTVTFNAIEDGSSINYTVSIVKDNCPATKTFDLTCSPPPTATVSKTCTSNTGSITMNITAGTYSVNRFAAYLEKWDTSLNSWQGNLTGGLAYLNPTASQGTSYTFTNLPNATYRVHLLDYSIPGSIWISTDQVISCTAAPTLTVWGTCYENTFTFTSTNNGSLVKYQAVGITNWSSNPGPYPVAYDANSSPYTLKARYGDDTSTEVTATYSPFANCDSVTPTVSIGTCTSTSNGGKITAVVPTGVYANNYAIQLRKNGSAVPGQTDKNMNPGLGLNESWENLADGVYTVVLYQRTPYVELKTIGTYTINCSPAVTCTPIQSTLTVTSSVTSPSKGQTVTLTASGTGLQAGTTYSWTGPGGFTSTSVSPVISLPTTDGTYTYTVTATNTNGSGTCQGSGSISFTFTSSTNTISAAITCTSVTISAGQIVGAGSVSAWLRDSNNNTIGTLYDNRTGSSLTGTFTTFSNSTPINLSSGTYYVFARQTGVDSNTISSTTSTVTCGSSCTAPTATMSVSQNGTATTGYKRYTFTLNASGGNPATYTYSNWSYSGGSLISGGGTSNQAVIEFPIPVSGTTNYNVSATVSNGCSPNPSASQTVSISTTTLNNASITCSNNTLTITGYLNGATSATVLLYKPDGTTETIYDNNPSIVSNGNVNATYSLTSYPSGSYYVIIKNGDANTATSNTVTCGGGSTICTSINSSNITINNPSTVTTGSTITLTASGGASGASYVWSGGTISSSGTVTLGAVGTPVTYTVTVTNPGTGTNCSATKSITITPTECFWLNTTTYQCVSNGSGGCVSQVLQYNSCNNNQTQWAEGGTACNCSTGQCRNSTCTACETCNCANAAPNQSATLTASTGDSITKNTPITFTFNNVGASAGDGGYYTWDVKKDNISTSAYTGNFSSNSASGTITPTDCGLYTITVTYNNCAGSVQKSKSITTTGCNNCLINLSHTTPTCNANTGFLESTISVSGFGTTGNYQYATTSLGANSTNPTNWSDITLNNGGFTILLNPNVQTNVWVRDKTITTCYSVLDIVSGTCETLTILANATKLNECSNSPSIELSGFNRDVKYAWSEGTVYNGPSYSSATFASINSTPLISNLFTSTNPECKNYVVRVWAYIENVYNPVYKDIVVSLCSNVCPTCPCNLPEQGVLKLNNLTGFGDSFYYEFDPNYSVDGINGNCRLLRIETTTVNYNNQVPDSNSVITSYNYQQIRNAIIDNNTGKKALWVAWSVQNTIPIVFVRTVCCLVGALGPNDSRTCWDNASPMFGEWVKINPA